MNERLVKPIDNRQTCTTTARRVNELFLRLAACYDEQALITALAAQENCAFSFICRCLNGQTTIGSVTFKRLLATLQLWSEQPNTVPAKQAKPQTLPGESSRPVEREEQKQKGQNLKAPARQTTEEEANEALARLISKEQSPILVS